MLAALATFAVAGAARAQAFNDGSPSRMEHTCWQGIYPAIPEDLAWTYVGFSGFPKVGDTYYVRVIVGGLGCSGTWVNPEMKLPPNTHFAVDGTHPIRCYLGDFGAEPQLTDGSCPSSVGTYTAIGGGFVAFPPATQPYWPLPTGKGLRIEVPVVSTATLSGIASSNDFLLGAAQFLDNSPGNPTPSYDAPPVGYTSGIPSSGAWQGVFVGPAGASNPTNTEITFAEPSATIASSTSSEMTVSLTARIFFSDCFCDSNRYPAPSVTCQNPWAGGAEACCLVGGVRVASVAFNMNRVGVPDDNSITAGSGSCSHQSFADYNLDTCTLPFDHVQYDTTYEYNYSPLTNALYYQGNGCAASGVPPGQTPLRTFFAADPGNPVTYNLLVNTTGAGSVTLSPDGGVYAPGTVVTATATADALAQFSGWKRDGSDVTQPNPYAITVNADTTLVAVFADQPDTADGGPTGGDGTSGGDSPQGGDGGPTDGDQDDGGSKGCNAAGSAVVELVVLAGVVLALRRRG